jgi:hypothetical protein
LVLAGEIRAHVLRTAVAVSAEDRSMRLRTAGYLIGAAFLAGFALMYARAVAWERDHNPQPLVLPISLAPGTIKTPEIKIDLNRDYDIVIDFEENPLRDERINIDIAWQLWDGTTTAAQGSSVNKPWQDWWGTVERTLGRFKGKAGHRYTLTLQVNPETSSLNHAGPILKVQIPRGLWEDYGAELFIRRLASYAVGVIGLLIVGGSFLSRNWAKEKPKPES